MICKQMTIKMNRLYQLRKSISEMIDRREPDKGKDLRDEAFMLIDEMKDPELFERDTVAKEKGYQYVSKFNKYGVGYAQVGDRYIVINKLGEKTIDKEYDDVEMRGDHPVVSETTDYNEGKGPDEEMETDEILFTMLDPKGEHELEVGGYELYKYSEGLAWDEWNKKVIDEFGNIVFGDSRYHKVGLFKNGLAVAERLNEDREDRLECYVLKRDGSLWKDEAFVDVELKDDFVWVNGFADPGVFNEKNEIYDYEGNLIVADVENVGDGFHDGWARVELKGMKWDYVDTKGKMLTKNMRFFDRVNDFSEGFAWVQYVDVLYFVDTSGKRVGYTKYENAQNTPLPFFNGGVAVISNPSLSRTAVDEGYHRFVDTSGEIIYESLGECTTCEGNFVLAKYDEDEKTYELVSISGVGGVKKAKGKYDFISMRGDGHVLAERDGMKYLLDKQMKEIMGPVDGAVTYNGKGMPIAIWNKGKAILHSIDGRRAIAEEYDDVYLNKEGDLGVAQGQERFYISPSGRRLYAGSLPRKDSGAM